MSIAMTMIHIRLQILLANLRNRFQSKKNNVILDDVPLERDNTTKFLGIIIDENLTWKSHIDAISKTVCPPCLILDVMVP